MPTVLPTPRVDQTRSMQLVLGVDGGESSTAARVVDATTGAVVGEAETGVGCRDDGTAAPGDEATLAAVATAVGDAVRSAGTDRSRLAVSVLALAAARWPADVDRLREPLAALDLGADLQICNDSFAVLRAGIERPWGLVSIVGSGAVTAGRNRTGTTSRSLGMGWGEPDGARSVVDDALHAVAAAHSGVGPDTALTTMFCSASDLDGPDALFESIERGGRAFGPDWCPEVFRTARADDHVAIGIVEDHARRHAALTVALGRRLGLHVYDTDVVLAGGLHLTDDRRWASTFAAHIHLGIPAARLARLDRPPVAGAVDLAIDALAVRGTSGQRVIRGLR